MCMSVSDVCMGLQDASEAVVVVISVGGCIGRVVAIGVQGWVWS